MKEARRMGVYEYKRTSAWEGPYRRPSEGKRWAVLTVLLFVLFGLAGLMS